MSSGRTLGIIRSLLALMLAAAGVSHCNSASAEEPSDYANLKLSLPYGFFSESFGLAGGWVEGRVGYPQPQASVLGTVMAGSSGSVLGFVMARDLQFPSARRLFVDPIFSIGYFNDFDAYVSGNSAFPNERAGTNDSSKDNFVTGDGFDNFARMRFKYLLPLGHGAQHIRPDYDVLNGYLADGATGGSSLNPLKSGRSFLEIRPFYRSQQVDSADFSDDIQTNGLDVTFFWDNRDFPINPTKGNGLKLQVSRDFGWLDSSDSWTVLQAEFDAYYDFGESEWFRSSILAFDFWTADTPSWEESDGKVSHRPPAYTGATLGGLWRMRGFPTQRFNDRSAIYYGTELRLTPKWNPFDNWPKVQKYFGVEWIQVAPFFELGRVASDYNLGDLHTDMQWDVGLGIRTWAQGFVLRADTAISEEGVGVQMMIDYPFQF
jgi:hypothetical protein